MCIAGTPTASLPGEWRTQNRGEGIVLKSRMNKPIMSYEAILENMGELCITAGNTPPPCPSPSDWSSVHFE